jgi:hypothetical protein
MSTLFTHRGCCCARCLIDGSVHQTASTCSWIKDPRIVELEKIRDQVHAQAVLPPDKSDGYRWEGGRAPQLICDSSRFDVNCTDARTLPVRERRQNTCVPLQLLCLDSKPRFTQQADWNSRTCGCFFGCVWTETTTVMNKVRGLSQNLD